MDEIIPIVVPWVLAIITVFVSRFNMSFSLDVNKWREARREEKEERLRLLCPHCRVVLVDDKHMVESLFHTPPGSSWWQCIQCGLPVSDASIVEKLGEQWANNPQGLKQSQEDFERLRRKVYKV